MNKPYDIDLDQRLEYLEQANLFKMMALNLSKEIGEFHSSISKLENPDEIFDNCQTRAQKIIGFKQISFFLVSEADSEFYPYCFYPETNKADLEKELDILVEDGTFSRAVLEKEPVTAYVKDFDQQLLLHVLATPSRVRGMFVGILEKKAKHIQEASFELFSILMTHCANALESFELYKELKTSNLKLQEKVVALSRSEVSLQQEILEHTKTEAALEASELQYRLLAETAKEMIVLVSSEKKIQYANPEAIKICGYQDQDLIGLPVTQLIQDFNTLIKDINQPDPQSPTVCVKAKKGNKIPLEINIATISLQQERSGYLLIGRDISKRLEAEKERKNLEAKLWQAQKMESIGLLASGISHDFNNILSLVVNYADMALAETSEDNPVYTYLENVHKASDRAIQLARKLYTIGRNDDHHKEKINVVLTIKETIDLLKSSVGKKKNLKTRFEQEKLILLAEETRVQQILMNLITNAGHALGNKLGTIVVSASRVKVEHNRLLAILDLEPGAYIKISVSDDGPGIEEEIVQRVFEPYFSTKTDKNNSGLGLSVVHGIVKNYQGGIDVATKKDKGTRFDIYLPAGPI